MTIRLLFCFLIFNTAQAQFFSQTDNTLETNRKKPVSFSHQPFLLLKVTPTAVLGRDNVLQYGVELAPPFGKFSFGFDYGKGKGDWSFNKDQKANHPEQETKIIRGEIRGYFSDWYPFYALDKKPFGRYYALEYVQKDLKYAATPNLENYGGTQVEGIGPFDVNYIERALHVKFGNHFIITKWFFIDGFVGIGVGQYSSETNDLEAVQVKNSFSFKRPSRDLASKGLFLSKTAGFRLCLPI
ncbi:hypothetical protein [uncultured Arcticibacterium sp.]|uniref:hypothetical protein n=1 Tax=uncultured Arcticibacterium sp. TaxID=2173042 RepID=UPI0030F52E9E